jgi:hypothetical protein
MKRPDLLLLVAIWEFLTALIAFIGVIAIGMFAFPSVMVTWGDPRIAGLFGLSIGIIILLAYLGLSVTAGVGVVMGKEWGRIAAIIHAALSVLNIPIGTVIGILILIYLTKPEIKEYFVTAER